MSYYIILTPMYNTGYIQPNSSEMRIKQGLDPQDVANACMYKNFNPNIISNFNNPNNYVGNSNETLYPAKQLQMSYNIPGIQDNCECTRYIKSP